MPRAAAENSFLKPCARSVVAASNFSDAANFLGVDTVKAGPSTSTKSCVVAPSDPESRSPSTPKILIARPRGVDTLSSRMSPGLVEMRRMAS